MLWGRHLKHLDRVTFTDSLMDPFSRGLIWWDSWLKAVWGGFSESFLPSYPSDSWGQLWSCSDGLLLQRSSAATMSGPGPGPWFLPAADKPQQELSEFLNNTELGQQKKGLEFIWDGYCSVHVPVREFSEKFLSLCSLLYLKKMPLDSSDANSFWAQLGSAEHAQTSE